MRAVSVIVSSDPASRLTRLGEAEVRELHAVAVLLESLAVRLAPPFERRATRAAARRQRAPAGRRASDGGHDRRLRLATLAIVFTHIAGARAGRLDRAWRVRAKRAGARSPPQLRARPAVAPERS